MATFYLINTTTVGTKKYISGDLLNDSLHPTADIAAAGGVLWPSADATIAAAGALVQAKRRARGMSEADSQLMMEAAVASALKGATGPTEGAALGDADATITVAQGKWRTIPAATLTAARALTLSAAGVAAGETIEITRLGTEAFAVAIINGGPGAGTIFSLVASKQGSVCAQFDGTNWKLRSFGVGS